MAPDLKKLEQQLRHEGYLHTFIWQDGPNAYYPEHTHPVETAHVILEGEMTLCENGATRTLHAGDRFDIRAGAPHSARMGPSGCRYLVGER